MTEKSAKMYENMTYRPFSPTTVQPGDMAVATDNLGDHYCVFVKRVSDGWEVLSVQKQQTMLLLDIQFEILASCANFRFAENQNGNPSVD